MKKYNKLVFALGFLVLLLGTSCINGIVGNGDVEERVEDINNFDRLYISGNFNVYLSQDRQVGLKIEADENLQDIIEVRQIGDKLIIECDRTIIRAKKNDLHITVRDLQKLDLSGAIDIRTEEILDLESLSVFSSGALDMNFEVEARRLRIDISGAAECDLEGKVNEVTLILSGAGDFNSLDMEVDEMSIEMSGAAAAKVHVTEILDVEISGAGSVKYKGDPKLHKQISGIGSLKRY